MLVKMISFVFDVNASFKGNVGENIFKKGAYFLKRVFIEFQLFTKCITTVS